MKKKKKFNYFSLKDIVYLRYLNGTVIKLNVMVIILLQY